MKKYRCIYNATMKSRSFKNSSFYKNELACFELFSSAYLRETGNNRAKIYNKIRIAIQTASWHQIIFLCLLVSDPIIYTSCCSKKQSNNINYTLCCFLHCRDVPNGFQHLELAYLHKAFHKDFCGHDHKGKNDAVKHTTYLNSIKTNCEVCVCIKFCLCALLWSFAAYGMHTYVQ